MAEELGNRPALSLLGYEGGRWRDLTRAPLPAGFDNRLAYTLPRRGTSIEARGGRGRRLYTLARRGDRFRLDRGARR